MDDRDEKRDTEKTSPDDARDSTKPSGQDVGPPGARVDDEVDGDGKTTKRQE